MSKISEIAKASTSKSFIHLNPEFFKGGINESRHKPLIEPEKPVKTNPEANKGHSSVLSDRFKSIWKLLEGPELLEEFKFHPDRKFRVDFCHWNSRTCIELEGGIYSKKGGHSSITGILRDIEKYNEMTFLGYRLFRLHTSTITAPNLRRIIENLQAV